MDSNPRVGLIAGESEQQQPVPVDNATNFPTLECLALDCPGYCRSREQYDRVSCWMLQQLRRSFEYGVAAEWA